MEKIYIPKKLYAQAGPFSSEDWKSYMEEYKGVSFSDMKISMVTKINLFSLFLYDKNLYIKRDSKDLTYNEYLIWVNENKSYDKDDLARYSFWLQEFPSIGRCYSWSKEGLIGHIAKVKNIIERKGEKTNEFQDQFKYWRKHWAVDESRFVKKKKIKVET